MELKWVSYEFISIFVMILTKPLCYKAIPNYVCLNFSKQNHRMKYLCEKENLCLYKTHCLRVVLVRDYNNFESMRTIKVYV